MAEGKKTEAIKGVYIDCPYDDGIPDNYADCGKNTRYISKTTAEVVDLISEDGIEGLVYQEHILSGTEGELGYSGYTTEQFHSNPEIGKLCSIYWNDVPIVDKDNSNYNFTNIDVEHNQSDIRATGFVNKRVKVVNEQIKGSEENTTSHYKYYKIYNKYCSKVTIGLKVGQLGKVDRYKGTRREPNESYGELLDSAVAVSFSYRALYSSHKGEYVKSTVEIVKGNFTSPYIRDVVLPLPLTKSRNKADDETLGWGDFLGWEILVIRQTEEPTTPDVKNSTFLDTITEEIDAPLMAPNSFLVRNAFSAEYFSSIPSRAYDVNLQKIKIPSNYDPITRTYQGNWKGTFSSEVDNAQYGKKPDGSEYGTRDRALHWTNNPAWCFYDLITNKRYGLGKYISEMTFDKWTLYDIAQYCDELVSDGDGKLEPRFTCNILIQSREDAFQVLNDMASVFRAIVYYNSGTVYAVQDSKKDYVFQFTNSNVENGDFNYTTTSAKVRHTVAIIRYNDKNNFYKPAVEYVDDVKGIRRYGIKEKEVSAFGCTSRGQAIRLGRWILATERLETETVTFTTGTEGSLVRPGDVFSVSDSYRLMQRRGGRVEQFTRINNSKFTILLDSKLKALDSGGDGDDGDNKGRNYQLTLSAPSFFYDPSQTNIDNAAEAQYIRNRHVQKFTITNEDIDYDSGNTGKSLVTVECNNCLNTAGDGFEQGGLVIADVVDKMSWSILSSGIDSTADSMQEQINQDTRYRAININEKEINKFEIAAVEYREEKYEEVDKALVYENTITFNVPSGPTQFDITNNREFVTEHTKAIAYKIYGPTNNPGLSYYAVFVKEGSNFTGTGVPSEDYLVDKIYSTAATASIGKYIPAKHANYYFRVYAVNSLGQYSSQGGQTSGYAHATANPGAVDPIKDVQIASLRLTDDTGANFPGISDPVAGASYDSSSSRVDYFDGSDLQLAWETTIPNVQGINVSFGFDFRIKIYSWAETTGLGTLLDTITPYKPIDWDLAFTSFELPLSDIIDLTKIENNGLVDLYDAYRGLAFRVDAYAQTGTASNGDPIYSYSSDGGNTTGVDLLYVSNPEPKKPSEVDGFIDINGHIKVFNVDRPMDAEAVYIIAAKKDFNWDNFKNSRNDPAFAFHPVKISPIGSDDPVFEMDPAFKTDDMEEAWVSIAYFDDFDGDILSYATENGIRTQLPNVIWAPNGGYAINTELAHSDKIWKSKINNNNVEPSSSASSQWEELPWYNEKTLFANRMSKAVEFKKVTPEVMDLIGEGWKAWLKIDQEGNWYGRNIHCVKDITHEAQSDGTDHTTFQGYIPFYCGRRLPLIEYDDIYAGSTVGIQIGAPAAELLSDYFSVGCLYYLENAPGSDNFWQAATYANEAKTIGAWFSPAPDNHEYWDGAAGLYSGDKFVKSFKRFRVFFKKNADGSRKFTKEYSGGGYWVVGMNVNHKPYFNSNIIDNIKRLPKFAAPHYDWETRMDGGALDALEQWQRDHQGADTDPFIGGSDAYFNYHPAGFVQGWGGLKRESDYFDIHLGHMIDGSYLKEAIFFVMASTQNVKTQDNQPDPCQEP